MMLGKTDGGMRVEDATARFELAREDLRRVLVSTALVIPGGNHSEESIRAQKLLVASYVGVLTALTVVLDAEEALLYAHQDGGEVSEEDVAMVLRLVVRTAQGVSHGFDPSGRILRGLA